MRLWWYDVHYYADLHQQSTVPALKNFNISREQGTLLVKMYKSL